MKLQFHTLTISDRDAVRAVSLHAGRRNCNYNFANLVGWQFLFDTEVCVLDDAVVLRYMFKGEQVYTVCRATKIPKELIELLLEDCQGELTIIGLEDSQAQELLELRSAFIIEIEASRDKHVLKSTDRVERFGPEPVDDRGISARKIYDTNRIGDLVAQGICK